MENKKKWFVSGGITLGAIVVLIILFATGVFTSSNSNEPAEGTAIQVGNQKIPEEWANTFLTAALKKDPEKCVKSPTCNANYAQASQEIADILYNAAAAQNYAQLHGITLTSKDLALARELFPSLGISQRLPPEAQKYLSEAAALQSKIANNKIQVAPTPPKISNAQAQAYYTKNYKLYHNAGTRDFIIIPFTNARQASRGYRQLQRTTNKSFVAQSLSSSPLGVQLAQLSTSLTGAPQRYLPPKIGKAAYTTPVNQPSKPFKETINFKAYPVTKKPLYFIVLPTAITNYPVNISFADAKPQIISVLQGRYVEAKENAANKKIQADNKKITKCKKPFLATMCKPAGVQPVISPYQQPPQ